MRTTLDLDDHLLAEAKQLAARDHRTLKSVVEDALRASLAMAKTAPKRRRIKLPSFDGGGVRPGVDLNNNAALLDLMEEGDVPH